MRQLRNWFFQITATATKRGNRFVNGDKPNLDTFKALVESTIFKTEADDRAKENDLSADLNTLNGHVVAATDVEAKANAAKPADRTLVAQPSQLPTVSASGSLTITAAEQPTLELTDEVILDEEIDAGETTRNSFIISIQSGLNTWLQTLTNFIVSIRSDFDTHIGPFNPGVTIDTLETFQELQARVDTNTTNIGDLTPGAIPTGTPVGTVTMWEKNVAPTGYLLLDGGTYLEATYPDLAAHYNGAYNTGSEAVGEFSVPDRTGYAPRGNKAGGIINGVGDVLGENRGSDTVGLSSNNLPYHKHDINNLTTTVDGDHTHTITIQAGDGSTPKSYVKESNNNSPRDATDIASASINGAHSHTVSGETAFNATTQTPVEITNPVFLVNFIVKALP